MPELSFFEPILIWLAVMLVIWVAMVFTRWQRKRRGARPPFYDLLLRSPGERLRSQIEKVNEDILFYLSSATLYPLLVYSMYLRGINVIGRGRVLVWIACGAVIAFFIWKGMRLVKGRGDLRLGLAGEMAVGQELNRLMLDGYRVYHDFPADRFNIDHIIVGEAGVFAVETKARSKRRSGKAKLEVEVVYDGKQLRFPSWVTTEPIDQAKAQASWLSKWLSSAIGETVKTVPVVVIPGWFISRKVPDGVSVLNAKEVSMYFNSKKESILSETIIQRICHQLEQKCRDVDLWEWY